MLQHTKSLESRLYDKHVDDHIIAIVCNQWGDTGKGKFVDLFGEWADIIARGNGGANAGHTIQLNDNQYIVHLLPSGILHENKINILGRGIAFDPLLFQNEIAMIESHGISSTNILVSGFASVVLPYHRLEDTLSALSKGIGTTGKGIGPLYSHYIARNALFVDDLLNKDILSHKIQALHAALEPFFASFEHSMIKDTLHKLYPQYDLYHEKWYINKEALIEIYHAIGIALHDRIRDEEALIKNALAKGKRVLLEGAQGLLLSVDYGTYPYVTSSDASVHGLAKGVGLSSHHIDHTYGILKFPYMTRVGAGPFPTELGGKKSEEYCREHHTKEEEFLLFETIKEKAFSGDTFALGQYLRIVGDEYGRTTQRPRRIGWFDAVAAKYAASINGHEVILTKLDVVQKIPNIKIGVGYYYQERNPLWYGGQRIQTTTFIDHFPARNSFLLEHLIPQYITFPGFNEPLADLRSYEQLPSSLKKMIDFLENYANVHVSLLSVGPDRNETILR